MRYFASPNIKLVHRKENEFATVVPLSMPEHELYGGKSYSINNRAYNKEGCEIYKKIVEVEKEEIGDIDSNIFYNELNKNRVEMREALLKYKMKLDSKYTGVKMKVIHGQIDELLTVKEMAYITFFARWAELERDNMDVFEDKNDKERVFMQVIIKEPR